MDRTEMEKLMDKYKQEMLEFQRQNGAQATPTEQTPYERDRSDPLPLNLTEEEPAIPAQTRPAQDEIPELMPENDEIKDVRQKLIDSCANVQGSSSSSDEQRRKCEEINKFLAENTESGVLSIQAFASDRVFGIGSARVMIFLPLAGGNVTLYDGLTDISGQTDKVRLPAPQRMLSMSPGANKALPYSEYSVYVEHPDYVRAIFTNIPVFSGVESIQPVRMLAKVEGANEPEPIVVNETAFGNL